MSSCCPICFKEVERLPCSSREREFNKGDNDHDNADHDQFWKRNDFQHRFFRLFERYVDLEDDEGRRRRRLNFEQLNLVGMLSCGQCLKLMESFCQLYDELKTIELFLNWKVETLKNVMKCAQRVPSRMAYFREFMRKLDVEEKSGGGSSSLSVDAFLSELVIKWRRSVIEKCSRKLSSALPNLSIAKWKSSSDTSSEARGSSPHDVIEFDSIETDSSNIQTIEKSGSVKRADKRLESFTGDGRECQSNFGLIISDLSNSPDNVGNENSEEASVAENYPERHEIVQEGEENSGGDGSLPFTPGSIPPSPEMVDPATAVQIPQPLSTNPNERDEPSPSKNSSDQQVKVQEGMYNPLRAIRNMLTIREVPTISTANNDLPNKQNTKEVSDVEEHTSMTATSSPLDKETFAVKTENIGEMETENDVDPAPQSTSDHQLYVNDPDLESETIREEATEDILPTSDNPPERRSILRATHRCHLCRKTCSSAERLQLHIEETHNDVCLTLGSEDGSDTGTDDSDTDHDDNMFGASSSSDTDGDNFESVPHSDQPKMDNHPQGHVMNSELGNATSLHKLRHARRNPARKEKYTVRCPECFISVCATKPCYLEFHMKKHENAHFRFKCPDCNQLFKYNRDILLHRRDGETCSKSYDPTSTVKIEILIPPDDMVKVNPKDESHFTKVHAIIELPQAIFICQIDNCSVALYTAEDMEAHKKLHGTFPCNFCKVVETYAPNLSIHELRHRNKKSSNAMLDCPRCDVGRGWRKFEYIGHHVRSHLSLTLNEPLCAICKTHSHSVHRDGNKALVVHFRNLHDLTNVAIPEDIKRCTIENCDAYFLSSPQLIEHLRICHGIGENRRLQKHLRKPNPGNHPEGLNKRKKKPLHLLGKHNCKDCDKKFVYLNNLKYHRLKHHVPSDKTIPCSFPNCTKVFESKIDLERHIKQSSRYHESLAKPTQKVFVECPTCGKSISGSDPCYLRLHLKSHESSNVCEQCGKVFKHKAQLDSHKLTHSGPASWQFQCDVCSRKCRDKGKLEEHMRTHTKDVSFVCQVCGNKYAHRHNLRIHVNSKHGDQVQDIPKKRTKRN